VLANTEVSKLEALVEHRFVDNKFWRKVQCFTAAL